MGRDKAMLTLPHGSRFLDQAIERASQVADEVVLFGADRYPTHCRAFVDQSPRRGPAGGIATALALAQRESFAACLVTPVDMPLLSVDDLRGLKRTWLEQPEVPVCGVCQADGRLQPLAAIYPVGLHDQLKRTAESDDRSLVRWFQRNDHRQIGLPERACRNINTPDDLSREWDAT
jgi:molybdopterin-guanine dinucleotide biosynthesis protein A